MTSKFTSVFDRIKDPLLLQNLSVTLETMARKQILYGVANYEIMVQDNGYFVDKTQYLRDLEDYRSPVFLRPRRFGKSLWCSILANYYDVSKKDRFEELFGHTAIGKDPTSLKNSFLVVRLDFSCIEVKQNLDAIEHSFKNHIYGGLKVMISRNKNFFEDEVPILRDQAASYNLEIVLQEILSNDLPPLYIVIDEYDNFANQLITSNNDYLYRLLTSDNSFFKTFFKVIKSGHQEGTISRTFITGVLPITMDDLSSGYNVAEFITLDPRFSGLVGFTQSEVDSLVSQVYQDYELEPKTRNEVTALIKNHYNGYQFLLNQKEKLYNSTILMYFLKPLSFHKEIPKYLTDENLKIDVSWIRRLTASIPEKTQALVGQLAIDGQIPYDDNFLKEKFNMSQFFEEGYFPISFFYLGMLTRESEFIMQVPNTNMRKIYTEYFNEVYQVDVSTQYAEMMSSFSKHPDLPKLFADYWRLYISQLPEAVFNKISENFYRTTFYELCSRYLSTWYTWNLERSYPSGRSDLEFVGKFHTEFASLRYVIEFKYYSHAEMDRQKIKIEAFSLQPEDHLQIDGYCQGLVQEYPEAKVSKFVIYCFGNRGFRVFDV